MPNNDDQVQGSHYKCFQNPRRQGNRTACSGLPQTRQVASRLQPIDDLPSGFNRLKEVLARSPELKVRNGEGLAFFVESNYDQVTESSDERIRAAKLGLLNLYTKMSNMIRARRKRDKLVFIC